ncbi:AlpA family phage regulatory protein [Klebsiella michiganensis]|uniref:helix-turn-helix transcriptional regulator n=1 Tax=Enterobacteriaceae TaxID=543 RepID=UPI001CCD440D|nr:AlpA family phage regulatory protein [Superficieibacter sp. HKU1]MBZ7458440.1 AlpA family phage regulatory protein [Klebsiella michiganensis]WES67072.1 AlpA family phage regulatory protein [Superficieibacter sp. HKU1]
MEHELRKVSKILISKKQLLAMIPVSERTIYNFEKQGKFPRRIALSSRKVVWDLAEVEAWIDKCKNSGSAPRPGMGG